MKEKIAAYQKLLKGKNVQEICAWALQEFGRAKFALATSLSIEDQALTDVLWQLDKQSQIFTLDTGRLPRETFEAIERTNKKYGQKIEILFPDSQSVEELASDCGPNLFYESIEGRKRCCQVRKVEPLRKKLRSLRAWMTGLRREQSSTRLDLQVIEWDEGFGLIKINPLVDWTEQQVWNYIKAHDVPYSALYDQGYTSIGCDPCTRAVNPGDDIRAGRWWWEAQEHKECGLHIKRQNNGPFK